MTDEDVPSVASRTIEANSQRGAIAKTKVRNNLNACCHTYRGEDNPR